LQQQGRRVRVYERAPVLDEIGAGITLAENARRSYQHLGIAAEIEAQANVPLLGATKNFVTGALIEEIPLQGGRYPVRQLHRADLHSILVAAVRKNDAGSIILGHEFQALEQDAHSVTVRFTNGAIAQGALVVGCDGNRSNVRAALFGDGEAEFLNYVAWRGLVPIANLPENLVNPDTAVFYGHHRSFVRYKLRNGTLVNYVSFAQASTWTADGWMTRSSTHELLNELGDAAPEIREIIQATPDAAIFKWGLIARKPLTHWSIGRATLLGDAAHAMLPFLGQGAGTAIEDAIVLARALAASTDHTAALARYEKARVQRTTLVMLGSRHAGLKMHGVNDDSTADAARAYTEQAVAQYDPVTVEI
jgi:salicylate hydroxylase